MSIQILGGLARGRTLDVPTGNLIRPTSVMLRRRLFDARQDMSSFHFYDLCSGSGSVGIEAWSRGAEALFLNEKNAGGFGFNGWSAYNTVVEYLDHYRDAKPEERAIASMDYNSWVTRKKAVTQEIILSLV
jgi:hypothetical protein